MSQVIIASQLDEDDNDVIRQRLANILLLRPLKGTTLGILGLGAIGERLAQKALALGAPPARNRHMRPLGWCPSLILRRQLFNSRQPGVRAGTLPAPAPAANFADAVDTPPTASGLRGRIHPAL